MSAEGYQVFRNQYKENGVERSVVAVTELANDLQREYEFKIVKWTGHLEGHFHYEAHDELNMTPEKKFEPDILNTLLDTALISICGRFQWIC